MNQSDIIDRPRGNVIAAERVKGTEVYNSAGDRLGTIDSIYIDKLSGEVAYVVMSFGGFLGIGEKFHPLPWDLLDYDTELSGYRVDLDRDALSNAPSYDRDDVDRLDNNSGMADVDSYYAPMARQRSADYDNSETGVDHRGGNPPQGFYSPEQQAARSLHDTADGDRPDKADAPGFYSPEQQASRNLISEDARADLDEAGNARRPIGERDTGDADRGGNSPQR